ncbi:hypothetical protein [Bacteroides sp.]
MSKKKRGEDCMKEEDSILKKVGTGNAFKVPEDYFENLTSEVMNKLPEKEKPAFETEKLTTWTRIRPWVYMAAMFIGAFLIIRVGSWTLKPEPENASIAETEVVSDEYIDVALDRSMMDDYSLYVYLTDAGAE